MYNIVLNFITKQFNEVSGIWSKFHTVCRSYVLLNYIQYHNKYCVAYSHDMAALPKFEQSKMSENKAAALLVITAAAAMIIGFIWAWVKEVEWSKKVVAISIVKQYYSKSKKMQ